jgi:hypothetical protein
VHRARFNGLDLTSGGLTFELPDFLDRVAATNGYAQTLRGEPLLSGSKLEAKTLHADLGVDPGSAVYMDVRALEDRVTRALEIGVPSKGARKLEVQADPTMPWRHCWAKCASMLRKEGSPFGWLLVFNVEGFWYSNAETVAGGTLNPRHNRLTNPLFETSAAATSGNDSATGWTVTTSGAAGGSAKLSRQALHGPYSFRLTPGGTADADTQNIFQTATAPSGAAQVASLWYGTLPGVIPNPRVVVQGATYTLGAGLTQVEGPMTRDGLEWRRYKANYTGDGVASARSFGTRGVVAWVQAGQDEPAPGGGANPRGFHYTDSAGDGVEYTTVTMGGAVYTEPTLRLTPTVNPAGRWKWQIGPLKCDSPANVALSETLSLVFTGAGAEVTAGRLRGDGFDLDVVDEGGRVLKRWIADTATANWRVWFEGLSLADTPRYVYLRYGNPGARNPARFEAPQGLRADRVREPVRDDDYLRHGRTYWYRAACVADGKETLASAPASMVWVETVGEEPGYNTRLRCSYERNADEYLWYRGLGSGERDMTLVGRTTTPQFLDTGRAPISAQHPRTTGSNPPSPYDDTRPLWDLAQSHNQGRRYAQFYNPARPRAAGSWRRRKRDGAASRYATPFGIVNRQGADTLGVADQWELSGATDLSGVGGQLQVRQHPNYYNLRVDSRTAAGEVTTVYAPEDQLGWPEWTVRHVAGASTLGVGRYAVAVTAYNATGETDAVVLAYATLQTANNRQIQITIPQAVAGVTGSGAGYKVRCSRHYAPRLAATVVASNIASYPHTITLTAEGAGETGPATNETAVIYGALTTLPVWNAALPAGTRSVRFWLAERERNPNLRQEYRTVYHTVNYLPAQAPTVADAVSTSAVEMAHLEYHLELETVGQRLECDLLDVAANQTVVIDARRKTVTADAQGRPQADAITLDSHRDRWLELAPGLNVLRHEVKRRADATADPSIGWEVRARARWP